MLSSVKQIAPGLVALAATLLQSEGRYIQHNTAISRIYLRLSLVFISFLISKLNVRSRVAATILFLQTRGLQ